MNELDLFKDLSRSEISSKDSLEVEATTGTDKLNLSVEKPVVNNAPTTKVVGLSNGSTGLGNTMTTKELAEALGVDVDTVNNIVKKLGFSEVLRKSTGGRPTKAFDEVQVTLIKRELQKHHNIKSRLDDVKTRLEVMDNMAKAFKDFMDLYESEKAEFKELIAKKDATIADQRESLDRLANADGCKSMAEAAKTLGFGQNNLFAMLRGMGVLFYDNGVNLPYQKYVDAGYFVVKMENFARYGVEHTYSRIYVTAKGMVWLERKLKGGVEE